MDPMWPPQTGSTSAFADEIGGGYEINKMIHRPLDIHDFLLDLATPDFKLKRKAPDANRDQERKKEMIHQPLDVCEFLLDSPPATPDSKLKRKAPDANRNQERKKEVDRAYRQRCKEKKNKNEEDIKGLTEENNRLQRENGHIKQEEERLREVVRTQNGLVKQLQDRFSQLKTQLDKQITLVDVLSKELAKCKDKDRLKHEGSLLHEGINNRDSVNVLQLEAKNTKLEQKNRSLQMIIDALCMKINQDSDHGIKEASQVYINDVDECWKL